MLIKDSARKIQKGASYWNSYIKRISDKEYNERPEDPQVVIENETFTQLELERYDFSFIQFRKCSFENCTFIECDISTTTFASSKFRVSIFIGGHGEGTNFQNSEFNDCNFEGVSFAEGSLRKNNFNDVNFESCHWDGDTFEHNVFIKVVFLKCNFTECDIQSCRYHFSNLWQCSFAHCSLEDVSIEGAEFFHVIGGSSFSFPQWNDVADIYEEHERVPGGCKFFSTSLLGCELVGLDFRQSELTRSAFERSNLSYANLSACSGLSTGAFPYCDLDAARLPANVDFDPQVDELRQSNVALQRLVYFALFVSLSVVLATLAHSRPGFVKLVPFGHELPRLSFVMVTSLLVVALQLAIMIRADNIACRVAGLPTVLPDHSPLPSKLRDFFLSDLCWRFMYAPLMFPGLAPRSYSVPSLLMAFFALYFCYPASVAALLWSLKDLEFSAVGTITLIIFVCSYGLALFGSVTVAQSFRGKDFWGREKESYN